MKKLKEPINLLNIFDDDGNLVAYLYQTHREADYFRIEYFLEGKRFSSIGSTVDTLLGGVIPELFSEHESLTTVKSERYTDYAAN